MNGNMRYSCVVSYRRVGRSDDEPACKLKIISMEESSEKIVNEAPPMEWIIELLIHFIDR